MKFQSSIKIRRTIGKIEQQIQYQQQVIEQYEEALRQAQELELKTQQELDEINKEKEHIQSLIQEIEKDFQDEIEIAEKNVDDYS